MARRRRDHVPAIEWIGGAIGALIVLSTIAYLAVATFRGGANETILTVTVVRVREQPGAFAVDIEVRNAGRAAAADVQIGGVGSAANVAEALPRARIDYVPGLSTRRATLVFPFNPGERPAVRVLGYTKP